MNETIEAYFRALFWHILGEIYIATIRVKIGSFSMKVLTGNHTLLNFGTAGGKPYGSYELFFQIIKKL
jgi:hypothetical protein